MTGVSQCSILVPLLFFIYVNDKIKSIESAIYLFADCTSVIFEISDPGTTGTVEQMVEYLVKK